jgi:hypothetical protein
MLAAGVLLVQLDSVNYDGRADFLIVAHHTTGLNV